MNRILALGLLVSGLAGAPALAQTDVTVNTGAAPADPYATTTTYAATGWDPSMLLAISGGLGAGSLALKGFLRKRS